MRTIKECKRRERKRERREGEQEKEENERMERRGGREREKESEREKEGMKERKKERNGGEKRRVAFDRFAAWKLAWKQRIEATHHATGKRDKRFLYDFTSMLVKPFFKTVFYIYIST